MDSQEIREMMSALADGQLRGDAFARALDVVGDEPAALQAWHAYHVVGDVLRSADLARSTGPTAFLQQVRAGIAAEHAGTITQAAAAAALTSRAEAANDGSFRWKLVAGVASAAAVTAVSWSLLISQPGAPAAQLATSVPAGAVVAASERGPMIRDPRLDELLAAHRQLGGASALQQPAGFLRNATFDNSGR